MLVLSNNNSIETLEAEFSDLIHNLCNREVEEVMSGQYDGRSPVMQKASQVWQQIKKLKTTTSI